MTVVSSTRESRLFKTFHGKRKPQGRPEPRAVAEALVDAGVLHDYFLYERQGEARIAGDCLAKVSVASDRVSLEWDGVQLHSEPARDPFKQVESLLHSLPMAHWTAFGYVAFDMAKYYHPYSQAIERPLLQFCVPRFEVRIGPGGVSLIGGEDPDAAEMIRKVADQIAHSGPGTTATPTPPTLTYGDRQDYCDKVKALTTAIRDGALQKAILSRKACLPGSMDLLGTYGASGRVNNAARSYCFRMGDIGAVGYSPEILLEADGRGLVTTNPLAGTRPRGADSAEDLQMWGELFRDPKEVKEHALSVLLVQEEMGSVCSPETVRIYDFMEVKKFRCVQHLSSRVSGKLDADHTMWDALRVLFPGVTVSGINKSSALRWISDMEETPRGIYGGGIGWVDSQGRSDIAIAIRSAFQYGNTIHLNAGAGIVAESVPEREYVESVNKMNTMLSQIVMFDDEAT
jgi:salicylate synthetase